MSRVPTRLALAASVPLAVLLLGGCSSAVSSDDVAGQVSDAIEEQTGTRPDVTCPEDLAGEVGAETSCEVTDPGTGDVVDATVSVSEVEGDTASLSIEVGSEEPVTRSAGAAAG